MRSCVAKRAFSTCLTKNATKAVVARQMGNMARYATSSSLLSYSPSSISRLQSPLKTQVPSIRSYSTEPEEILKVPFLADSITKGDVATIFKKVGDKVKTDETIISLDTDKTSAEINAPYPLEIVEILTKEGESVNVGQALVKVRKVAASAVSSAPKAEAPKADTPKEAPKAEAPKAEAPKAAAPAPSSPSSSSAAPKAEAPKASASSYVRTETREKMTTIRQRTAERLKGSQNTAAMLTTFQECDTSAVAELRAKFGDDFLKKHGVKLGFMSVFVKASVAALQDQPIVNAYNDISVAVATPRGLVVPVLRDCQNKSMAVVYIEKELGALGARARLNQVSIEEMVGGTFTISNGGVYGSLMGTPIINPPQSAILGMHGIFKRPIVVGDKVEIRPMMYIALTYDHRLIDGREAVTFLRKIKDVVEDPRRLLLEL